MAKFCMNCGAQMDDSQQFCSNCGANQNVAMPNVGATPNVAPTSSGEGKSRLTAGLLGVFLGGFGVHNFYLGNTGTAIAQIIVSLVTCYAGSLWGMIEGFLILAGKIDVDAEGRPLVD